MQMESRLDNIFIEVIPEPEQIYTKLNLSMEKKIERLWQESEKHGWKFSQFVTAALEVLTILHHRNKLRITAKVPKKILHRKHALS